MASDVYLYAYEPKPGDTVLDLGAGIGQELRVLSRLVGPAGRVVSVEAHPRTFDCLRRTINLNGLTNITAINCAATAAGGPVHIEDNSRHITNSTTTNSTHSIQVDGRTLSDIVAESGVDRIDLLKMNIEGAELTVLEAASDVLPMVRNLVVSCHDFLADRAVEADRGEAARMRTFAPVTALLRRAGYTIHSRPADPRAWIPYYVYATRQQVRRTGERKILAGEV